MPDGLVIVNLIIFAEDFFPSLSKNSKQKTNQLYSELTQQQTLEINKWDSQMDQKLVALVEEHGEKCWDQIASNFENLNEVSCLLRYRHIFQIRSKKGTWNATEDQILTQIVTKVGKENMVWTKISKLVPGRNPKQCRERWKNQLDPTIDRSPITREEEELLVSKIAEIGSKWCKLATFFKGRPDNMLKNYWYSTLSARLKKEKETQEKEQDHKHKHKQSQKQELRCKETLINVDRANKSQKNGLNLENMKFPQMSKMKLSQKKEKQKILSPYVPPVSIRKRNRSCKGKFANELQATRKVTRSQSSKQRRLLKKQNHLFESFSNFDETLYFTEDFQLSEPFLFNETQIKTDPRTSCSFFEKKNYETSFSTDFNEKNSPLNIISFDDLQENNNFQPLNDNNQIENIFSHFQENSQQKQQQQQQQHKQKQQPQQQVVEEVIKEEKENQLHENPFIQNKIELTPLLISYSISNSFSFSGMDFNNWNILTESPNIFEK
ncbi:transcription factor myb119-related [Anaeramoeba flamelloides]|uniref:Transcription factor myb119-related n=1 Tax=Anaeramoeba flamelloides TaxID=1746091 RepID=A0AAV7Z302_9EUKA|nr:transcription factor myb119-related [Anaeramoeba flamelloides]